jgi:hypothetical protein
MAVAGFLWKLSRLVGVHLALGLVFKVIDFEENCLLFGHWARSMSVLGIIINVIIIASRHGLGRS